LSRPVVSSSYTYHPPGRSSTPYDVTRSTLDVGYFKDLLFSRITSDDDTLWEIHEGISRDYVLQVVAEQRTLIERRIGPDGSGKEVWRWVPRIGGAANHFLDCEVYCLAAAYMSDAGRERGERGTSKGYEVADDDGSSWSFQRGGRRR